MMKSHYGYVAIALLTLSFTSQSAQLSACQTDECKAYFAKFKAGASRGHDKAIAMLGEFYYQGYGVEKNVDTALKYYKKAARRGITSAQYKAGLIYLINQDRQNTEKGIRYLKQAAQADYKEANFLLGRIFLTDEFNRKDLTKADLYLAKAYQQEHADIPMTFSYILSQYADQHETLFPRINKVYEQKPLVLKDNMLAWAHQGIETITVSGSQLSTLFDLQLKDFRHRHKSLGSRIPTMSCADTAGCYQVGSMQELSDLFM